jgi:hypothetical protein
MHKRQGYLDGEDQKTLISFVLYGDPLAVPHTHGPSAKNTVRPIQDAAQVKIVCDRVNAEDDVRREIPTGVVKQVKGIVKEYLPGMNDAKIILSHEHTECTGHNCPTHQIGAKGVHRHPSRSVVTLSKHIEQGSNKHPHYARITLNKDGKMVKLAVSR